MQEQQIEAPAKLNLTLAVTGRRADGYHTLRSVMVPLRLADRLRLVAADSITVECPYPGVPDGEENLAYRAAAVLRQAAGVSGGVHIHIDKRIPPAAGLAGGSANAAAVLAACNRLWELNWPLERLMEIGLQLGADVPFCLLGRAALAEGVGELLTPLPDPPPIQVVLAMPRVEWTGPKTATVFRAYQPEAEQPDTDQMVEALRSGAPPRIAGLVGNALEPAATRLHPIIGELRALMEEAGAQGVAMTGAGPTVFALCTNPRITTHVAAAVEERAAWVAVTSLGGGSAA